MSLRVIDASTLETTPTLSAWNEVEPAPVFRRVGRVIFALMIIGPMALAFVPWRQNVHGSGRVIGYAPLDRQFNVESPLSGRVREWFVMEGAKVTQGQIIARISDNDPNYLSALDEQLSASKHKLETAEEEVELYHKVVSGFEQVRDMATNAAMNGVEAAKQKVSSEEQEVTALTAAKEADRLQYERLSRLLPAGLTSSREFELADQKYRESSAKLLKAQAALAGAKSDLEAKKAYLSEIGSKNQAEIEKARAEAKKSTGKVDECRKELQDVQVKIRRQTTQDVVAPRDGTILRLLVNAGSEQVKDGDPIAIMVPDTADLAVEMWVDGNDAPLVEPGSHVRLQFEGWPAVQFAGWPSVAIGSFGGEVKLVDAADNGKGKFRIVVKPGAEDRWPSREYLRQGVRAKGWVLLGEVPLGYELWRRMNGFPQAISDQKPESPSKDKDKDPSSEPSLEEKVKSKRPK
ncbi:MAG: biotin/lipoyl-binding protein [Isosphaeraceae bacterium]|nr:biotin/lipoyl-binding protein [Isosphaeraceae bacterium]